MAKHAENPDLVRWLEPQELAAWRSFHIGHLALMEKLDRELRAAHGLSLDEYYILVWLEAAEGDRLRMAQLAELIGRSRSRLTHTVARMEADGLVTRSICPEDRRGVLAHLTDRGRQALVRAAPTHVSGVRQHLVDVADPNDLAAMGRLFQAVADRCRSTAAAG